MTKGLKILLLLFMLAGISWGVYECRFYLSYQQDLAERPWAYSEDKTAKRLAGNWAGEFRDPDGVHKNLHLEILEPVSSQTYVHHRNRFNWFEQCRAPV
ncbi:hypothetical protein [Larkinella rosea]|uniref:Uncharacterized protein n=1 Tax=Larkinella rosea TaxID=2025312 RepID=A0A3P1C1M6_9BACT|nr:hypothetical protein [Larkinella rosea]RRB06694.1 hypothetical protein EHT25_02555 [Larkinella rosea]